MDSITELGLGKGKIDLKAIAEDIGSQGPTLDLGVAEPGTKSTMETFKPIMDKIDFNGRIPGDSHTRKLYTDKYKAILAHQIGMLLSPGDPGNTLENAGAALRSLASGAQKAGYVDENTLAGAGGVLAFGRQVLAVLTRAYPRLISPQLFPVRMMQAAEARIYWESIRYFTAFASSTPNVSVGDRTDDLSKFNTGYPDKGQMGDANLLEADYSHYIVVTSAIKRLATVHSVEAEEDLQDFNGTDLPSVLRARMSRHLQWVIDRTMINAAVTHSALTEKFWNAQPTIGTTAWSAQSPSEQQVWNQTLWSTGANSVINAIANRRYVYPNWCIAGSKACEALQRVSSFVPLNAGQDIVIDRTSVHDFGAMAGGTMRVLRDPQLTTNLILFGYAPEMAGEPAIYYCPHRPVTFLPQLTDPRAAKHTNGAYTRFGVGQPNYTQDGESNILGECYGRLWVENYY